MRPPPLNLQTTATVAVQPQVGLRGEVLQVVMVKQRYAYEGGAAWPVPGAEVLMVDALWCDEPAGSVRVPGDLSLARPGTDVVVVGSAFAPGGVAVTALDVVVRAGPLCKAVRVYGRRVWYEGAAGLTLSPPQPFVTQPLRWEDAWGGREERDGRSVIDPRNPYGRGVALDPATLLHREGPHVEDPDDPVTSPTARPRPAGIGALSPGMPPRDVYAGTMDQRWLDERFPLRPLDFDARFFHCAVPELASAEPFVGGEAVSIAGMHPAGEVAFRLPRRAFFVGAEVDGMMAEHPPRLDTVVVHPNDGYADLTWRSVIPTPRPERRLRALFVYDKERVA